MVDWRERGIIFLRIVCVILIYAIITNLSLAAVYSKSDYVLPDHSEVLKLQGYGIWVLLIFTATGWKTKFKYPTKHELSALFGFHFSLLISKSLNPNDKRHNDLNNSLIEKLETNRVDYTKGLEIWHFGAHDAPDANRIWDKLQLNLKCCGIFKADEWSFYNAFKKGTYPPSCCSPEMLPSASANICEPANSNATVNQELSYIEFSCMQRINEEARNNHLKCCYLFFIYFFILLLAQCIYSINKYLKSKASSQASQQQPLVPGSQPFIMDLDHHHHQQQQPQGFAENNSARLVGAV